MPGTCVFVISYRQAHSPDEDAIPISSSPLDATIQSNIQLLRREVPRRSMSLLLSAPQVALSQTRTLHCWHHIASGPDPAAPQSGLYSALPQSVFRRRLFDVIN